MFSPVCRINRVCETENVLEVRTSKDVQQGKRLVHFTALDEKLLQTNGKDEKI